MRPGPLCFESPVHAHASTMSRPRGDSLFGTVQDMYSFFQPRSTCVQNDCHRMDTDRRPETVGATGSDSTGRRYGPAMDACEADVPASPSSGTARDEARPHRLRFALPAATPRPSAITWVEFYAQQPHPGSIRLRSPTHSNPTESRAQSPRCP